MPKDCIVKEPAWIQNRHLSTEVLTPLEERISAEKPHLAEKLRKLKDLLGAETFERYINPAQNLNQSGKTVLLVAKNAMHRSHIERTCIPALKTAFNAAVIRIIGN